jgi:hypothetical protein
MAKSFHQWKEGLKKNLDRDMIEGKEQSEARKGPESKGFKKK